MIFGDSSFFIGLMDKKDQWHKKSLKLLDRLKDDIVISDLVLSESVTMIGYRSGGEAAGTIYNYFTDNCIIKYVDEDILDEAVGILTKFDGKLSVADSVSIIMMKRNKIKIILSFDSDFDKIKDITRIF